MREDRVIGACSKEEAVRLLVEGTLKPTDQYWEEGGPVMNGMPIFTPLEVLHPKFEEALNRSLALYVKAEGGDAVAQRKYAIFLMEGVASEYDVSEAVKWFRKAAEQGDAIAQRFLGALLVGDKVHTKDYVEALMWTRRAADQGDQYAQCNLAEAYAYGQGLPKDAVEASKWYLKSAEQGNSQAQQIIGAKYYTGDGVPKDPIIAIKWSRRAAEQGDPFALYNVGLMLTQTRSSDNDTYKPYAWFSLAASKDFPQAKEVIKDLEGRWTPETILAAKNLTKALAKQIELMSELRPKAQNSDVEAQRRLADVYYNSGDFYESANWYSKAAEQGDPIAQGMIGHLYFKGHGVPKDWNESLRWTRSSAESGCHFGQYNLGLTYLHGYDVPVDFIEAAKWFRKAAEQGRADAQHKLGQLLVRLSAQGSDVAGNLVEAYAWLSIVCLKDDKDENGKEVLGALAVLDWLKENPAVVIEGEKRKNELMMQLKIRP